MVLFWNNISGKNQERQKYLMIYKYYLKWSSPKLSAIGINKSQAGRGPGKSTEVKEYV
jgi:hypothetical protein